MLCAQLNQLPANVAAALQKFLGDVKAKAVVEANARADAEASADSDADIEAQIADLKARIAEEKARTAVETLKQRNLVVGSQANVETVLGHEAIVFDDSLGAVSLEQHVLSLGAHQAELNEVAVLVKTTITKHLEKLHAEKLVFVDIHPGNIVGSRNADGKLTDVWLIDYECVCAVGTLFGHDDILGRKWFVPRKYREADSKASVDGDFESLSLVLAWILNLDDFRLLISSAPSDDQSAGNSQWENINASALVDLKKWMAEHDAATSSTSTSVSAASENKKG